MKRRPLIVAHRGASEDAPENTMRAFELAREQGADMIELDVQMSADGALVVFHDDDLRRCTDVAERFPERADEPLCAFESKELKTLSARRALPGAEPGEDVRIPELSEVLTWARECGMRVNIEIKSLPRLYYGIADGVVEAVKRAGMRELCQVSSFHHGELARVRASSELATALLTAACLHDLADYARRLGVRAVNLGAHLVGALSQARRAGGGLDRRLIDEALAAELEVYVWTVNDENTWLALATAGVTGIITDRPAAARTALA